MAGSGLARTLGDRLHSSASKSNVLVVGAGGIGCELLKNLVMSGFRSIDVIDLDTIDVSNLNRQFLFQKQHVGKSKAEVARESCLRFNPDVEIKARHDSIFNPTYDVDFFKSFNLVMNALDNRAARNHVNRLCLAADVPLIESGTAGYLGQVTVIKKGKTECYECQPKPHQKTFPGCTIRNTPSEPIHCIVWAKHLFNQLFGEPDPDMDVSPDTETPEAAGDAGAAALAKSTIDRVSTRSWAELTHYDAVKIFNKLFCDDIKYLLSMEKLWEKRKAPVPLSWSMVPEDTLESGGSGDVLEDQKIWTIQQCCDIFSSCLEKLKVASKDGDLVWDKDDETALDFVTAAANVRAHIFSISRKSRFDVKSMAGNIIPAIATTNAVIAGLIVMNALKVLDDKLDECQTTFLNHQPVGTRLLSVCRLENPNPKCYVCASKPEVTVKLNVLTFTVSALETKLLKGRFGMRAPDVEISDGKGTILISSEPGETEGNNSKTLSCFGIASGTRLQADDFLQNYQLVVAVYHSECLADDVDFEVEGDPAAPKPEPELKMEKPGRDEDDVCLIGGTERRVGQKRKAKNDDGLDDSEAKRSKLQSNDEEIL